VANNYPAIMPVLMDDIPQVTGCVVPWNGQPVNALTGLDNVNLRRAFQHPANSDQ
jgi:hypothetical protein